MAFHFLHKLKTRLFNGTDDRDVVFGTKNDEVIDTKGGGDTVFAGHGNNKVDVGAGDDYVFSGKGDDEITIGAGNDFVSAGKGFDTVVAAGSFEDYGIISAGFWNWRATVLTKYDDNGNVLEINRLFNVEAIRFDDYTYYLDGRNNAPFAKNDVAATDQDTALVLDPALLLNNDSDPEGDSLSIVSVAASTSGATVSLVDGKITYDPTGVFDALAEGETATDTFTYTVKDEHGATTEATVTVTITGRNDAPVISGVDNATVEENSTGVIATFSATDVDGDAVTYTLAGPDAALFNVDANGQLTFKAPADYEAPKDAGGDNVYNVQVVATDAGGLVATQDVAVTVTDVEETSLVISEIMYNPASSEDAWEWIEVVNTGTTAIDLSGWVLDDINGASHSGANIASGVIQPGQSAVLYNADDISAADFTAAWGEGINLIAVTDWGKGSLNNSGDTVGLWSSYDSYQGDHETHANAVASVAYDDSGAWPRDNNSGSIYLKDLDSDANDGSNWALSTDGGDTPVNTGETAQAAGGNSGADVGSPGGITPVGDVLISEFRPNPNGADPAMSQVELSGNPGAFFSGYIVSVEGDPGGANPGDVNSATAVSGTFDANGLLTVEIPDLENPSFTLIVTDSFTGSTETDIDTNDDGTVDDKSAFGTIYDAIGTPDSAGDEATVYGAQLGGTDFAYTGDEPQLIFRDGSRGDLYAVNDPAGDKVYKTNGDAVATSDFSADPTTGSFGALNPTFNGSSTAPLSLVINELLADPASGTAGDANGDGTRNGSQDEFVEIVNTGTEAANLSGVTISDAVGTRHTFAEGTTLEPGAAIVVFGGGTPTGDFGGAQVVTATAGFLGLNNSGDTVTLAGPDGTTLDTVTYGSEGGQNQSLTRSPELTGDFAQHSSQSDAAFSPGTQADGTAFGDATPARDVVINELRHTQSGPDNDEFIELKGTPGASLDGLTLVGVSGEYAPGKVDFALDLSGGTFDENGIFVIARDTLTTGTLGNGDLATIPSSLNLFGSPSTYMVVEGFSGTAGADLDTDNDGTLDSTPWTKVLDAVSFVDGDDRTDVSYSDKIIPANGNYTAAGVALQDDGTYKPLPFNDTSGDTPGAPNQTTGDGGTGGTTLISQVQGSGSASPLVGQTVTVTAIVVGDFQNGDGDTERNLGGFFLQEEASDSDGNAATSEGVFIYEGSGDLLRDVNLGDRVTVTGTVNEFRGSTQITATSVTVDQAGAVADVNTMAQTVTLGNGAVSDGNGGYVADLEAHEGMLITLPQTLTVSEAYNMDRFGEIGLTAGGRPTQFTQTNAPDAAGYQEHLRTVAANRITYDDGKTVQNPTNVFPEADLNGDGVFNTADGFGMGDTITNATGVLGYAFNEFRVHSVQDGVNTFEDTETREETPPSMVGADGRAPDVVVSSFNVLNFFTTLNNGSNTAGPGGLSPRGAQTVEEYNRQLDKLLTTLQTMNADIYGLVELENEFGDQNGDGTFAIKAIVDGLNARYGEGTWAYVDPGRGFVDTGDAISVGIIYKTSKVSLVGAPQILDDTAVAGLNGDFGSGPLFDGQSTNRAPLAANFQYNYTSTTGENVAETFTVAVTHMKSKGGTGTGGDADQNDGAGNYNETRTEGVRAVTEWLNPEREGAFADQDQIVLGDFNAYARETPITTMTNAGYLNLEEVYEPGSSTFVFDGQTGTLDYAFASSSLADNVTNAGAWNINSAEPDIYDYNLNLDRDLTDNERDPAIFDGDVPYRTSDHDPMLVGLNFSDTADQFVFT